MLDWKKVIQFDYFYKRYSSKGPQVNETKANEIFKYSPLKINKFNEEQQKRIKRNKSSKMYNKKRNEIQKIFFDKIKEIGFTKSFKLLDDINSPGENNVRNSTGSNEENSPSEDPSRLVRKSRKRKLYPTNTPLKSEPPPKRQKVLPKFEEQNFYGEVEPNSEDETDPYLPTLPQISIQSEQQRKLNLISYEKRKEIKKKIGPKIKTSIKKECNLAPQNRPTRRKDMLEDFRNVYDLWKMKDKVRVVINNNVKVNITRYDFSWPLSPPTSKINLILLIFFYSKSNQKEL